MKDNFRNEVKQGAKDTRFVFFRFLPIFVIALVFLSALFFVMRSAGLVGKTIVERQVFENSYQRSESLKSALSVYEAQLSEINSKLQNSSLDSEVRSSLKAQKSGLNVRIAATKGKM